jgi:hypothetical protein
MRLINNFSTYSYTIPYSKDEIEYGTFIDLKKRWLAETLFVSDPNEIYSNESYNKIIRYGYRALPYILADLEETNHNWFFALAKIIGHDAVKNENRGDVIAMTQDWMNWKKNQPTTNVQYASTFAATLS